MFKRTKKAKAMPAQWSLATGPHHVSGGAVRNKALLIGGAVFVSTRDIKASGYVKLAPRQGVRSVGGLIGKQPSRLHVAVSEPLMRAAPRGTRFALAVDAYLAWGLRSKGKTILIGGYEDGHETTLDVLVFEDGRLLDYENKALPAREEVHFHDTVASLLDDIAAKWPNFKVFQAPPLTPFGEAFAGVAMADERIFKRLSFRPLALHSESKLHGLAWPAAVIVIGMCVGFGALAKGWSEYHAASAAFDREVADPVVSKRGGVDSGLIDTIQQRRFYLDEPRRQVSLVEKSKGLVAGVGKIAGLKIVEIKLPAPVVGVSAPTVGVPVPGSGSGSDTGADRKPDVWLKVSVPLQAGETIWNQGKALMTEVSANTGMSVRLARQGWSEDGKRRLFTLEGFING